MEQQVAVQERSATIDFANWKQDFEIALRDSYEELKSIFPNESDRFIKAVWLQFRQVPKLQKCTRESIQAAATNLMLSGLDITQKGEAWLIPMENRKKDPDNENRWYTELECVVWDGYLGRIKLARQSPGVIDVWHDVVRDGDVYKFNGQRARPEHSLPPNFGQRGRIKGAYCVVEFEDGRVKSMQMSVDEILKHRDQYARAANSDIWQEFIFEWQGSGKGREKKRTDKENRGFQHMCAKVVINQLCHPRHIDMPRHAQAIITRQEEIKAQLMPVTGEDLQPQEPVAATSANIPEMFGETHIEEKQELLAQIRADFGAIVVPIVTTKTGPEVIGYVCFGCSDWKDLPNMAYETIRKGMARWERTLDMLRDGMPEDSDTWSTAEWTCFLLHSEMPQNSHDAAPGSQNGAQGVSEDSGNGENAPETKSEWFSMLEDQCEELNKLLAGEKDKKSKAYKDYSALLEESRKALGDDSADLEPLCSKMADVIVALREEQGELL